MSKNIILAACLAALLAGCATTGGDKNPNPVPPSFPDCWTNPWDPWCRPPMPPVPPIPPLPTPRPH